MAGGWDICGTWRLLRLVYLSDALSASFAAHLQLHMPGPPGQIRGKAEHKWLEGETSLRLRPDSVWQSSGKEEGHPQKHSRADWNEGVEM